MLSELAKLVLKRELKFEIIERAMWLALGDVFRQLMAELLEAMDKELMTKRDVARYENKGLESREVETLVGAVRFKRHYYWDREVHRWVYLLDEKIGLKEYVRVSPGVGELAVVWGTKGSSYRDARDRVKELVGYQVLSHEAIRRLIKQVAEQIRDEEAARERESGGSRRVEVLFCEVDGLWTTLQRGRGKRCGRRRREVKQATVHEGWRVRQGKGRERDYALLNPTHHCSLEESGEGFWEGLRAKLAARYAELDRTLIVINGDGAEWIREGEGHFGQVMRQRDRFHIKRELMRVLKGHPERLGRAREALDTNDIAGVLAELEEAERESKDPRKAEELRRAREDWVGDREAIADYRVRLKDAGVRVKPHWRGLGAAESNVDRFKNRIGKRGRSWSREGLDAILTALCKLYEGTLPDYVRRLGTKVELPEVQQLRTGAGELVTKRVDRSLGAVRRGHFPALDHGTRGFAELFKALIRVEPVW